MALAFVTIEQAFKPFLIEEDAPTLARFQPSSTLFRAKELSMMGLAARFHEKYFRTTRYVEARNAYFNYEGGLWHQSKCLVEIKTKKIINDMDEEHAALKQELEDLHARERKGESGLAQAIENITKRIRGIAEYLPKIKKPTTMTGILDFARSDLLIGADDYDPDHTILNVKNGVIDLETGGFREHRPEDLCSMQSPVEHAAGAPCERWRRFLDEIFLGDQDVVKFIQRAIGYSLSGDTSEQVFFILHGDGSNGKSELLYILDQLLGAYLRSANVDTFMDDKPSGGHNEDIARLRGCRLVTTTETEKSKRLAEGLVKRLTGGDVIAASFKHERTFEFTPRFKVWLAANHKPRINGTDHGIWRRIMLVPFEAKFLKPGDEITDERTQKRIDPNLRRDLLAELPGILNWAVEGYQIWRRDGLKPPQAVNDASKAYREESDKVGQFLADELLHIPGARAVYAEVYERFRKWAESSGVSAGSKQTLSSDMKGRGIEIRKMGKSNISYVMDYGLLTHESEPENG